MPFLKLRSKETFHAHFKSDDPLALLSSTIPEERHRETDMVRNSNIPNHIHLPRLHSLKLFACFDIFEDHGNPSEQVCLCPAQFRTFVGIKGVLQSKVLSSCRKNCTTLDYFPEFECLAKTENG
jgi:hypothetical protein